MEQWIIHFWENSDAGRVFASTGPRSWNPKGSRENRSSWIIFPVRLQWELLRQAGVGEELNKYVPVALGATILRSLQYLTWAWYMKERCMYYTMSIETYGCIWQTEYKRYWPIARALGLDLQRCKRAGSKFLSWYPTRVRDHRNLDTISEDNVGYPTRGYPGWMLFKTYPSHSNSKLHIEASRNHTSQQLDATEKYPRLRIDW